MRWIPFTPETGTGTVWHSTGAQNRSIRQRQNKNDSISSQSPYVEATTPSILVVEPSRELTLQVYGGVPMSSHAAMLSSKTDVVIVSKLPELICTVPIMILYFFFLLKSLLLQSLYENIDTQNAIHDSCWTDP